MSTSESFSSQLAGVAAFYMPRLRKQLIFYTLISIVVSMVLVCTVKSLAVFFLGALSMFVANLMFYFGPLIFASRGGLEVETALPVSGNAKALFIMVYSYIVIPLLIGVPALLVYYLFFGIVTPSEEVSQMIELVKLMYAKVYGPSGMLFSLVGSWLPVAVCLYCVMTLRRNRIVMSIVWTIVVNMAAGIIGGIAGTVSAFNMGLADGMSGAEPKTSEEVIENTVASMGDFALICGIVMAICTIFVAVMTYRSIKNRQI